MEARDAYTGMQSDFHTHVHALPPQMGGCYENGSKLGCVIETPVAP